MEKANQQLQASNIYTYWDNFGLFTPRLKPQYPFTGTMYKSAKEYLVFEPSPDHSKMENQNAFSEGINRINALFQKRHSFALRSPLATAAVISKFVVALFKNTNPTDLMEEQRIKKEVFRFSNTSP